MLESSLPSSWNKNILEVILEKDERGAFNVSDAECSNLLKKLGIDSRPGVQLEQIQICPNGRGVIIVTLKQGIEVTRFCRYDVLQVTRSGIRAVNVKPAGKRDVVVNIKGLHPNTRDDGVINYLGKYGKIVSNKVVYGAFGEGPLKGIRNGNRSFKVEINPGTNIGTYHAIDGQRVTLRYPGQLQTCARCYEDARTCKGGAIAKKCEAQNGIKVEFSNYIIALWKKIEYVPGAVEMAAVYDDQEELDDTPGPVPQVGGLFTPDKKTSEPEKFGGVSLKQFPRDTDPADIMEFLVMSGLPESVKENVVIKPNGTVTIDNLENKICLALIEKLHLNTGFGKKLFCNGMIPLTPEKPETKYDGKEKEDTKAAEESSNPEITVSTISSSSPAISATEKTPLDMFATDLDLVGRHSQSIRTPPPGSIASELLEVSKHLSAPPSFNKTRSLITNVKDLIDRLSSYGSCLSDSSGDESDTFLSSRRRGFKRSAGVTPIKGDVVKKVNLDWGECQE